MASGLMPAWLSRFWSPPSECTHHVARDQPPVLESSGSSGGAHPVILCSGGLLRGFARVRRHFFDAQSTARDAAKGAIDFILEVYAFPSIYRHDIRASVARACAARRV